MKRIFALALGCAILILGLSLGEEQFISLFNGKDLTVRSIPREASVFGVVDDVMIAGLPNGSDIFSEEEFVNYIFRFEFLLSEVGNSGALIHCIPENPWGTGVEVQLLAPWTSYRDYLHCTGSPHGNVTVSDRPDETTGIWHQMKIKYDRNLITVLVDGKVTAKT